MLLNLKLQRLVGFVTVTLALGALSQNITEPENEPADDFKRGKGKMSFPNGS